MIWSDGDIAKGLARGAIKISAPFTEASIQPASVDLRLGGVFWLFNQHLPAFRPDNKTLHPRYLDPAEDVSSHMYRLETEGIIVHPGSFVLGMTQERVSLDRQTVGRVEGKSSLGRLGLTIHSTAGFIDPGNQDLSITLEIFNQSPLPIMLRAGMWICQLAFENTLTPCLVPYGAERGSRYYADQETTPSRVHQRL